MFGLIPTAPAAASRRGWTPAAARGVWAAVVLTTLTCCLGQSGLQEGAVGGGMPPLADGDDTSGPGILPTDANGQGIVDLSELVTTPVAARKLKAVLTGGVPTDAEYAQLTQDPNAVAALVDAWLQEDGYKERLRRFFVQAFQQSGVTSAQFASNIDDGQQDLEAPLVANFRDSFARTAVAIVLQHRPFTEVFTTQTFEMTTAMKAYLAYSDTTLMDDRGKFTNRWLLADPNFTMYMQKKAGNVPLSQAANFRLDAGNFAQQNPNAFHIYNPNLGMMLIPSSSKDGVAGQVGADACAAVDPLVFDKRLAFNGLQSNARFLYQAIRGKFFAFQADPNLICYVNAGGFASLFTAAEYDDWQPVAIRGVAAGETPSVFFDVPTLKAATQLRLITPRVGFFTTPAFLPQWSTNQSNSARAVLNQSLIVALGAQIAPTTLTGTVLPAVDAEHAGNPACLSCHQTLDPMRQYFRQTYTVHYSAQQNQRVVATPAHFSFQGVEGDGNGLVAFGALLASHPKVGEAWAGKVCAWLNSGSCQADAATLSAAAAAYRAAGDDFQALVRFLASDAVTTYLQPSATSAAGSQRLSVARRSQACAMLARRLAMPELCGLGQDYSGIGAAIGDVASNLPEDSYGRGVTDPTYTTAPDPFYRSTMERLCAGVAAKALDTDLGGWRIPSADAQTASVNVAQYLLGVEPEARAEVAALLAQHVAAAKAAGSSDAAATRSMFIAACASPLLSGVGL